MAIDPKGYSYKSRSGAEYQRFKEEYFSGQDCRIYFGDIWVDEIVDLRFQLVENTAPIFGYASYTFDAIAKGNRQVQGTIRVNFKESYYLHSIINQLDYEMNSVVEGPIKNTLVPTHGITVDHLKKTIESVVSEAEFDRMATQFEKSLWGKGQNAILQDRVNTRGSQSYFYPEDSRKNIAANGFNILILYGPYAEKYTPDMTKESVASTARSISGVHLTGLSQVIDGSGQPVYEEYSFIARDIDTNINLMDGRPKYKFGL